MMPLLERTTDAGAGAPQSSAALRIDCRSKTGRSVIPVFADRPFQNFARRRFTLSPTCNSRNWQRLDGDDGLGSEGFDKVDLISMKLRTFTE